MTLDMMFANFKAGNAKADDKQNLANKTDAKQDAKQAFADKMTAIQEGTVNAAWESFKENIEGLPAGTPAAEAAEQAFKQCCNSAISAVLLAAALMC